MATVGRVVRAHGNRGYVVVSPETDFPDARFQLGQVLWTRRRGEVKALKITQVRFQQKRPVLGFEGLVSMDGAEALAGAELRVPLDALAALPADTYYRHDLVGCHVATVDGHEVGTVTAVEGASGVSRLVVARTPQAEVLVPLAEVICVRIDIVGREIVIDPPEGLLELNQ